MSDILLTEQTIASATPAAGRVVIYPKNDGYLYFKNDTGTETRVNPQTVATAAEWAAANPTLAAGVFGVASDTGNFKIGDGATAWNSLAYWRYTAEHITIATTGGNTNLTIPQSRASSMAVTGALVSNVTITTPDTMALFVAENLTTGAFSVTFKTAAGSGIVIPQGGHATLYADGVSIENPVPSSTLVNVPAGNISATTVQAAINELDTEKAAIAGSASQAFSVASLDIGNADTTLTRVSAGVIAVEGVTVATKEEGTWTPTITAGSGIITTSSGTGQYQKVGNVVEFKATLTITTNGTGAGSVIFTLPFMGSSSNAGGIAGRESGATGSLVFGYMNTTQGIVYKYDGVYPAGDGYVLNISGWYFV